MIVRRIKKDAAPVDNITKFAYEDTDYELLDVPDPKLNIMPVPFVTADQLRTELQRNADLLFARIADLLKPHK